jgi:hypothetical protein
LYKSKESVIVIIQSVARGFLARKMLKERHEYLKSKSPQIAKIQAWWRMIRQRKHFTARKKTFQDNQPAVVKIQAFVRMWLTRRAFIERKKYLVTNVNTACFVPSFFTIISFDEFCAVCFSRKVQWSKYNHSCELNELATTIFR